METSLKAQKQLNVRNILKSKSKSHIISNSTLWLICSMLSNILRRTFSGIYVRNTLSYFKFHIIFFLLCNTSKKY